MIRDVKRGEIYQVDWSPARGSEQAGRRPALVIQNDTGNKFSPTTIVASCSTAAGKSYPFLVPVKAKESGLRKDCTVNLASIMTIEKARLGDRCGMLNQDKMAEVDKAIKRSLGLDG
jgi:mRNA interferase MazF